MCYLKTLSTEERTQTYIGGYIRMTPD